MMRFVHFIFIVYYMVLHGVYNHINGHVFSFMILLLHLSYFTWDKIVLRSFSSKIACSKLYSYTNKNQKLCTYT